ncbi:DEAD/DEAH box helicase [Arcanobacterium hippocoleae]|uniref:RNA helicase n=1 Tax=Arcanobacterium hippocoleae TaxID=149017 RepID=A0ABU1T1C3_9ACTO|nr:DEAD/DEAH box helicase [Arcanobacterium hippocoleae]MDR6938655.1 superfamily II DNA/RNA helicase [Arcanobacterium hippocoleae]
MTKISGIVDSAQAKAPNPTPPAADITGAAAELGSAQKSFADFGLSAPIVEALAAQGITHPFPIQALTLPIALKRADIIGQAKTGTGKTFGFGLPMLENIIAPANPAFNDLARPGAPQGLIVLPTRELAKQVAGDLRAAAKHLSLRIMEVYGGIAYEPQQAELKRGVEIVVGTPGRLIDLQKNGSLDLSHVQTVVLDEADEMLDLGFLEDVETILSATSPNRHTMLFSATMPGAVIAMARRYMNHPTHIRAQDPNDSSSTVQTVQQVIYRCHEMNKPEVISRILQARNRGLTIIFTKTKRQAGQLTDELETRGFAAGALHGNLGQGARERALRAFRKGKIDILVATDVAARGIDIDNVTHVVNYQCPEDEKTYLHRIGRTGRAGHNGTAITFVDWEDTPRWAMINKALNLNFPTPVETYHTSEHLYSDLNIPNDVTGKLPYNQRVRAGLTAEAVEDLGETGRGTHKNSENRSRKDIDKSAGTARKRNRTRKRIHKNSAAEATPNNSPSTNSTGEKHGRKPRNRRRIRTDISKD